MSSNSAFTSFSLGELLVFIQGATQMSCSFRCQHPLTQVRRVILSSWLPTVLAHLLQKQFPLALTGSFRPSTISLSPVWELWTITSNTLLSQEPQVHTLLTSGASQPSELPAWALSCLSGLCPHAHPHCCIQGGISPSPCTSLPSSMFHHH